MSIPSTSGQSSGGSFRVDVERRGDSAVVSLIGSCEMLESERLTECMVTLAQESTKVIAVDLSRLEFIESTGLGAIIAGHLRLRHHQGELRLVGPQKPILRLLELTRLTQLFHVYPSVDAALTGSR